MSEIEPYYITKSKEICIENGMDPNEVARPKQFMTAQQLQLKKKEYQEILSVISYFSNKLLDSLKGTPILTVISDSDGYLVDMIGDDTIKSAVEQFGIQLGSRFTQQDTGTNVISIALQQRHPVSLIGENHYHKALHGIACYGAPFHYSDEDNLLGTVNIMVPLGFHNPLLLTMLSQVVESIERELLLRKQNRKLNIMNQILLNRTGNGIIITDEKGLVTQINEFAQEISNKNRSSAIGKSIYDFPLMGDFFKRVIGREERFENEELRFTSANGEPLVCLLDVQPIYEDSKMIGAFGQFRDITDRYLIEEKIKEAEKEALAGRIAAGIAHEIRNPLTTVRGYLQFLEKDVDENISELFSSMLIPEIDRANKIISDFLSISKPSYKEFKTIQVESFFNDYIWKFLKSEALLHNVEIELDLDPKTRELSFFCNREELLQVFLNLFQNSLQAKGSSPLKVNIRTRLENSQLHFIFTDNGLGIPVSTLTHIFEPFFSTKDEGTGLGLSVSRKIVEKHDGTMTAVSNGNGGARFLIELPYSNES
ncbi:PAS domain S-box-containing protein [Mesobacillus persicus]|uniref:histidine kinase n=1 Tax=Mesobacillus persicus TaxID=930146 RepID=A0A1H8I8M5_9BACI|nr:ATP-binding protein [Mesobacillus persicus]SEN64729.1 PAS domain S-box-containing protein [Mesobacillus persicus]